MVGRKLLGGILLGGGRIENENLLKPSLRFLLCDVRQLRDISPPPPSTFILSSSTFSYLYGSRNINPNQSKRN